MMNKPYVIAEIGVNFYDTARKENLTPLEAAKKYISAAKQSGADAVKFQAYKADTIVSKDSPAYWDLTQEPTKTQYELFQKHDGFGQKEYKELCKYCMDKRIDFVCTPFDYNSADFLENMVAIYKISSSDLTNLSFIKHIAKKGKPIYLSVGASYLSEVEEAVRIIKQEGCKDICLLHCVLSYPCSYEDANLSVIQTLKSVFPDIKIGYSDHTKPDSSMTVLSTAYLLGAEVIEKHFTLDKTLKGNDHYHSADPIDLKKAVDNFSLIQQIYGKKEKRVLPCEEIPRKEARRSLILMRDFKQGEILKESDLIAKRPGIGISPKFMEIIIGRPVKYDLPADTILTWDMI